jgi:hypothetical protein
VPIGTNAARYRDGAIRAAARRTPRAAAGLRGPSHERDGSVGSMSIAGMVI